MPLSLLFLLLTAASVTLQAEAQSLGLRLYYTSPGVTSFTRTTYGDVGIVQQVFTADASTGTNFYVKAASLSDPSSFITMGSAIPTTPSGSNQALQLAIRIDPAAAVAGVYNQTITLTASPNNNAAIEESADIVIIVTVLAALNYYTNTTDVSTGVVNSYAPLNMTEGTSFSQIFSLRSKPTADVTVTITANAESGEIVGQVGPLGQSLRGGGPLITLSTSTLVFTPANFFSLQQLVFNSIRNPQMQGSRWTLVTFQFSSSDTFYSALTLAPLNITILERDYAVVRLSGAGVTSSAIVYRVTPGVTGDQYFYVNLGAQPLSPVTLYFPSQPRWALNPNSLVFDATNFDVLQSVRVRIQNSTVISGARFYVQNFTTTVSADSDFNTLPVLPLELTFSDPNNVLASLSPPFAQWTQTAENPTYVTISYDSTHTFLANSIGEAALPTVSCVFGNTQFCDDPEKFFGPTRSAGCEYPYAQTLVQGNIISPTQVSCPVPTCPSTASTQANPGIPATRATQCSGTYHVVVLVNGEGSSNAIQFIYLLPVGSAGDNLVPQINSIEPDTIDVNEYEWITLHGANFDTPAIFPNPTLPSGKARTETSRKDLTACLIGGLVAPAVDVSTTEVDSTGNTVRVVKCLSRPRPDLAGSSDNVPVTVEMSVNGQEFTANAKSIAMFDYDKKKYNNAWTYFFIAVALVGMIFAILLLQHFLCANFFKTHLEAEDTTRIHVTKGPQMLIDLLEPQVRAQDLLVKELEKEELQMARQQAIEASSNEDLVKARIAEIQREAQRLKEEKRRLKAERKLAKEAAKQADKARQEVLAAAGLAPAIELDGDTSASDAETSRAEKEERKRKKKEKKAAKEAAAVAEAEAARAARAAELGTTDADLASPSGGVELTSLTEAQLAQLSPEAPAHQRTGSRVSSQGDRAAAMALAQAAALERTGTGYSSDGSVKSTGSSSKKKKDKKEKKEKKEKKAKKDKKKLREGVGVGDDSDAEAVAPRLEAPAAELEMVERKQDDEPEPLVSPAIMASPLASPSGMVADAEEAEASENSDGGGLGSSKKKKKKSSSSKKKKSKKEKSTDSTGSGGKALSPAMAAALTVASSPDVAASAAYSDASEVETDGEEQKKKSKKSKKSSKDKDNKSSKKKKKSSKE